jgi:hypothetical protein
MIGGTTQSQQSLAVKTKRSCPWQIFIDPETNEEILERTYDPKEEPLVSPGN